MDKNNHFPQYRMLSNGKIFYKIHSDREFEEIQLVGTKLFYHKTIAKQYPDILKVKDMLILDGPYEPIDAETVENLFAKLD